jgi:NSS family neurotransmitter:Na+ symporter
LRTTWYNLNPHLFQPKNRTGFSKIKTCIISGIGIFILSIPCILGFNLWSSFEPLGAGTGVLDLEDYLVSNILLPVGSLVITIFCTQKFGWGFKNYMEEANHGKGAKVQKWMRFYMTWILPLIIIALFLYGIYDFFF